MSILILNIFRLVQFYFSRIREVKCVLDFHELKNTIGDLFVVVNVYIRVDLEDDIQ